MVRWQLQLLIGVFWLLMRYLDLANAPYSNSTNDPDSLPLHIVQNMHPFFGIAI
jgi:hypothetical protein